MPHQINITTQMPASVTRQVPEALRNECLPGFSLLHLSGTFGYVLVQSVSTGGIGMYFVKGELPGEFSCGISLPSPRLAIWILTDGMMSLQERSESSVTLRRSSLCLIAGTEEKFLVRSGKGSVAGMLFLYPFQMILSVLSFHPQLNDLRTSLEENRKLLSVHPQADVLLMDKLHALTHTPFIPAMEEFYRHTLTEIAHQVFSGLVSDTPEPPVSLHDIACIRKAKDYIDEHLSTHFSIRQIARHAGINQLKLKVGFKEIYGAGLYGYLRQQRLMAAHTALTQTRLTLKEISRHAGYKSLSNFCTAYKRQFGITPGEARKQKNGI